MTRDEIMALSGLALREAVCERLGITPRYVLRNKRKFPAVESSLDAARLVEDEVKRRGLENKYIRALIFEVPNETHVMAEMSFMIRRATPQMICRAALLAATMEGL